MKIRWAPNMDATVLMTATMCLLGEICISTCCLLNGPTAPSNPPLLMQDTQMKHAAVADTRPSCC